SMKGDRGRSRWAIAGWSPRWRPGAAWLDRAGPSPAPRSGQKSMQRPFFSQSPYRVGSGPPRPPNSSGGGVPARSPGLAVVASGTSPSATGPERWSHKMSGSFTSSSLSPSPMSDKPSATNGGYFAIPEWSAISLRGEHATTFAQAQFMGDLAGLAPGHWQWNGWLTPKGRLVALFALLKLDETSLLLLLPDADPGGLVADLGRFRFRSRVEIAHEPGWSIDGRFG